MAHDQNPAVQEAPLRCLIAARGWELVRIYTDRVSGAKENRPALSELMADARRGAFDVVLVWRFDRLSRSVRHFLTLIDELTYFRSW
jgi:DNA invertase Pin-like site-specific DNA recombinase